MSADFTYDAFISYSSIDKDIARNLAEHLRNDGLKIWFDDWGVRFGDNILLAVEHGLQTSRTLILCLSEAALDSDWVSMERSSALFRDPSNASRRFLPVLLSDCNLPDTLRCYKYLDMRQFTHSSLRELSAACRPEVISTTPLDRDPNVIARPINLGFDGAIDDGYPHGWFDSSGYVSGVSTNFEVRVATREEGYGRCVMLRNTSSARNEFASVMQRFPAERLASRVVKLEGELRTENVRGWAGLWMRADGEFIPNLFFDNMHGHRVTASSPWTRHSIEGKLPAETRWLNIGIVFVGRGTVWADDLSLTIWSEDGVWARF